MTSKAQTVLVTGGSGYAGQFLVHTLSQQYQVHYTYGSRVLPSAPSGVVAHKVDLVTGEGLRQAFEQTIFHAIINCAAVSQPVACEAAPEEARAVNVPRHLVDCLLRQEQERGVQALLVHFSTDQVYDGSHAMWKEEEPSVPVNVYGKTKLEAEQYILSRLPETYPVAILRCSIIYGPPPPAPVHRTLFLQFVASAVRGDQPTTFFEDEWRNPVYVKDLEGLVLRLIEREVEAGAAAGAEGPEAQPQAHAEERKGPEAEAEGNVDGAGSEAPASETAAAAAASAAALAGGTAGRRRRHRVYNTGGPERLSRVEMAHQVADCLGCSHKSILAAPSASVSRPVATPSDISMDISRLAEDLGFRTTPFREALKEVFSAGAGQ